MNILLLGNGGREHALAWKIKQSPLCKLLLIAPGNPGTALEGENVSVAAEDFPALGRVCVERKIDLVVVGPEGPLVKGVRDFFESQSELRHILMIGPGREGAQLEGSKDFSKQFMIRNNIPTARARTFLSNQSKEAIAYLENLQPPYVLKADGLAAGKGVIISSDRKEAEQAIVEMLEEKKFGDASSRILIEEYLDGIELSVFVLTDGKDYVILPEAKDYKRIGENDAGPNTGGMGAVSPVVFATREFMSKVESRVIVPTVSGLHKEGIAYRGFIFVGLMNVNGEPYVIEYNARMGDPETQAVMSRIDSDFVELLRAAASGTLRGAKLKTSSQHALVVSLVSGGYPGDYQKGKVISSSAKKRATVFHAGTRLSNGALITDGGRVLSVTATGPNLSEARKNAYDEISGISWDGLYFRRDIGVDLQRMEVSAK
jgi:phosphoribosylamine---glycine ligase